MFRTLQNQQATISIFHSQKLAASGALYLYLQRATEQLPIGDHVYLDLNTNKMPTWDQFQTIVSGVPADDVYQQQVLRDAFPLLRAKKIQGNSELVTITGAPQMFNEGEYKLIYDAFNKLQSQQDQKVANAEDLFQAPLVVDWDKATIANDEPGVAKLLEVYAQQDDDNNRHK